MVLAFGAPNGGYARPGADWALVTECHPVLGQLSLLANLLHLHVGVTESRNRETKSEPACGSLPTMTARARPR
jgi:hypothetical protein